jgi:hypothetical protein
MRDNFGVRDKVEARFRVNASLGVGEAAFWLISAAVISSTNSLASSAALPNTQACIARRVTAERYFLDAFALAKASSR